MILVTGGTGFVGSALVKKLAASNKPLRILLRPSAESPNLPKGTSVEVAVSSLTDERGLRSAMKDVDVIFHLAGSERMGSKTDLNTVDVIGSQLLAGVAQDARVERILFLSHLGADRASAYPVMKAKAIAEGFIMSSGIPYTIFRSGILFGPGDQFTVPLLALLRMLPGIFLVPGKGTSLLQPLFIDDMITCLLLAMEDPAMVNQNLNIGGMETFSYAQVVEILLNHVGMRRKLISVQPAYLKMLGLFLEQTLPNFPVSVHWLDYLATDRTCALDSLPRTFGILPARFTQNLDYLTKHTRKGTGQ